MSKSKPKKTKTQSIKPKAATTTTTTDGPDPVMSIRPGILVSLSCRLRGGVNYHTSDLRTTSDGDAEIASWRTERRIDDPEEFERGIKTRTACRVAITQRCIRTSFGLVCRSDQIDRLNEAIAKAQAMADEYNAKARYSQVMVYLIRGRIDQTDTEAMRAIGGELREMLRSMNAGILRGDPKAIREAVANARQLSQMLDEPQQQRVSQALQQARDAARAIVKRVEKNGEKVESVVADLALDRLAESRFTWLDIESNSKAE